MSSPQLFDQAAFTKWYKEQQQQVANYLRKLQVFDTDITGEWLWIVPHRAMLGRAWPKHGVAPKLWIITGVVPTDHAETGTARNCREVGRYFALKWQMEAARLGKSSRNATVTQGAQINWLDVSDNIAGRAEWLYSLVNDNRRWTAEGLPQFRIDHEAAQA
ncbi:MAG: DUF4826 family protein [Gammaproteobacteria bacterium]